MGAPEGAPPRELDFPDDTAPSGQRNTTYEGKGGVSIGSPWRKLLFAMKYQEANILLSGRVNSESKVLYIREPKDRVKKVAPWLTLDGDAYPAIVGRQDRLDRRRLHDEQRLPLLRPAARSEEATTDSRTTTQQPARDAGRAGQLHPELGQGDGRRLQRRGDALRSGTRRTRSSRRGRRRSRHRRSRESEISEELLAHLRYPEDLFKVQRTPARAVPRRLAADLLQRQRLLAGPERPDHQRRGRPQLQPPYYVTLQMPGQSEPSFSLTSTYVPVGDRNNLSAFVSVNADPGPDYGKFRVLQLPRSLQINGPSQVQNQLESDDVIAEQINILKRGTTVRYGNLLTFPVAGGLLYVEPVYVQADAATSFPLLRKVLVSFGNEVAFEDTLDEALDTLFADQGGNPAGEDGTPTPPPTEPPPDGEEPPATAGQPGARCRAAGRPGRHRGVRGSPHGRRLRGVRPGPGGPAAGDRPGHRRGGVPRTCRASRSAPSGRARRPSPSAG